MTAFHDRSLPRRLMRRGYRSFNYYHRFGDAFEEDYLQLCGGGEKYTSRILFKRGFLKLILAATVAWMLLAFFVLFSYALISHSSRDFSYGTCNKEGMVYSILKALRLIRCRGCPIPVITAPENIVIPVGWSPDNVVTNLTYIMEDELVTPTSSARPLFGGNINWSERESSFNLKPSMKVRCGFTSGSGAEMAPSDIEYVKQCRFVVASGIFGGYDVPNQPLYLSTRSQKLFCFLMMMDERSVRFVQRNVTVRQDDRGGLWVGLWRIILIKNPPYDETRRNARVAKLLTHRFFPRTQYSIWIDAKLELVYDPLLMLERYLWRERNTYAIAQHRRRSIYEEADANKILKRYAGPLVDLQMKIYRFEGMEPWNETKWTVSDVPDSAIIIREHTKLNNLFHCLWFNEVNFFTPRDQLSFGYVVYRLGQSFRFFMFPYCEFRSLFRLHNHTREHAAKVDSVKSLSELKGNGSSMKDGRGGLGLWTPYPADLESIDLSDVMETFNAKRERRTNQI